MGEVANISKEELKDRIRRDDRVQLLNVLTPEYYCLGMIPGSLRIPWDEVEDRTDELNQKNEVIVYDSGKECDASRKAAEKLNLIGFNVKEYAGGIEEWKN
ncbi:MAG: rhodanese-like domain-containing protein [Candidatus Omnitrophica bacterium]|nr:rhodanese-like domain-containing protein [Candidatus Omnitrophota bacterium]